MLEYEYQYVAEREFEDDWQYQYVVVNPPIDKSPTQSPSSSLSYFPIGGDLTFAWGCAKRLATSTAWFAGVLLQAAHDITQSELEAYAPLSEPETLPVDTSSKMSTPLPDESILAAPETVEPKDFSQQKHDAEAPPHPTEFNGGMQNNNNPPNPNAFLAQLPPAPQQATANKNSLAEFLMRIFLAIYALILWVGEKLGLGKDSDSPAPGPAPGH